MLKAFATPQHRRVTFVFLAIFCVAVIGTLAIGLDGNIPALALGCVAGTALVLAFVHPWRRAREFRYLLYASALGFVLFAVLHNLFDAGADVAAGVWPLHAILQVLGVVAFLAAILVCPPAFVIGLGGALIMFFRGRKGGQPEPPA